MRTGFEIIRGNSPIVTAAIHEGHAIREEVYPYVHLKEHERAREEDPYSGYIAEIADTRIIVHTSRFEVDLNRPRNLAVYRSPQEAWGLSVWKTDLPLDIIDRSLDFYDEFYSQVIELLWSIIERFGFFIVLDIHTYNHRRQNIFDEAPPSDNPEINIGSASVRPIWRPVIQDFVRNLGQLSILNQNADVRENVKFLGGEFCRWINRSFGQYGCAIAIEFKKTFMDEWTGVANIHHVNEIRQALAFVLPQLRRQLEFNVMQK